MEVKVVRESQEVLRVNGKIVTVEAGIIVNNLDLKPEEFIAASKFINDTIHMHVMSSLLAITSKK